MSLKEDIEGGGGERGGRSQEPHAFSLCLMGRAFIQAVHVYSVHIEREITAFSNSASLTEIFVTV